MRLGDAPESGNFEDRTGQSGGGGLGGIGGGLIGAFLPMILSKFGIVGVLVLALGYCALSSLGGGGGILGGGGGATKTGESKLTKEQRDVLVGVLESTDQVWTRLFAASGAKYVEPQLVAYSNQNQSGCGAAQAAMGPFYCPTDQSIYIDPDFFNELSRRFQAPGDFAQGYVIAHEVGHHVQKLEGTLDRASSAQSQSSKAAGNAVQVGVELQADCYAGVWAKQSGVLEAGDIEEGMRAAEAIGDDMLTQGRVSPDNFTHGTSAQRMEALRRGLQSGDPAQCNYAR
ncbi:neutral zinc metallopeptidase [Sphingomonas sp. LY160]|uniref:KPN_02809 family neutral zinc metallopeptidase n=1 Tax=Sphingomonas sp. LY160 TaxID=3095342 RepID=UPI002ADEBA66|nr:neutral zinc metallopeptidase [Sphingomonas sp. LY160]MEA1071651.1 neutral zinc metallopeptidase [Sphingomonas sp. LY160]